MTVGIRPWLPCAVLAAVAACARPTAGPDARESVTAPLPAAAELRRARVAALAEQWPPEPAYAPVFDALDPGAAIITDGAPVQFDATDEFWGLPRTRGYLEVAGFCGYCHSLRLVMQQRATPARWNELLDWMVTRQGMPALDPQDRATVLGYLARHFGPGTAP